MADDSNDAIPPVVTSLQKMSRRLPLQLASCACGIQQEKERKSIINQPSITTIPIPIPRHALPLLPRRRPFPISSTPPPRPCTAVVGLPHSGLHDEAIGTSQAGPPSRASLLRQSGVVLSGRYPTTDKATTTLPRLWVRRFGPQHGGADEV